MSDAELQGADLSGSNLTHSNISHAKFDPMSDKELKILLDGMSRSINDAELRNKVKKTLLERTQKVTTLAEAAGEHIWSNKPYGDVVHTILHGFGNKPKGAENETEYQNKLSIYLIGLSCQDQWVATGIIENRIWNDAFDSNLSQCLLALKDQKNQSDQLVCPALSEIDEDTVTSLKRIAAIKYSDKTLQSSFECKTELSDPPSGNTNP